MKVINVERELVKSLVASYNTYKRYSGPHQRELNFEEYTKQYMAILSKDIMWKIINKNTI